MTIREDLMGSPSLFLLIGFVLGAVAATAIERKRRAGPIGQVEATQCAPLDDEPTTPADLAAISSAQEAAADGEVISWQELRHRRHAHQVAV